MKIFVTILLMLFAPLVFAGPYLGIQGGVVNYHINCDQYPVKTLCDDEQFGYRVYAGLPIIGGPDRWSIAVELSYLDAQKAEINIPSDVGGYTNTTVGADVASADVLLVMPFYKGASLAAVGGLNKSRKDTSNGSDRDRGRNYGAMFKFPMSDNIYGRFDYRKVGMPGEDLQTYMFGVNFGF